jgi:hypothetical protein
MSTRRPFTPHAATRAQIRTVLRAVGLVTLLGACAPSHQHDGRPVGHGRTEYAREMPPVRVVRIEVSAPDPDVVVRVRDALIAALAPRYESVADGAADAVFVVDVTYWRAGRPGEVLAGGRAECRVPGEPPFFESRFRMLTFDARHGAEELGRWLAIRFP